MTYLHLLDISVCQADEILLGDQCIYSMGSDSGDTCSKRKSHKQPQGMSAALAMDIAKASMLLTRSSLTNKDKYSLCFRQGKVIFTIW